VRAHAVFFNMLCIIPSCWIFLEHAFWSAAVWTCCFICFQHAVFEFLHLSTCWVQYILFQHAMFFNTFNMLGWISCFVFNMLEFNFSFNMLEFNLWHFMIAEFKFQHVQKNPACWVLKNSMCQHRSFCWWEKGKSFPHMYTKVFKQLRTDIPTLRAHTCVSTTPLTQL
jgi:hypothetical protein